MELDLAPVRREPLRGIAAAQDLDSGFASDDAVVGVVGGDDDVLTGAEDVCGMSVRTVIYGNHTGQEIRKKGGGRN